MLFGKNYILSSARINTGWVLGKLRTMDSILYRICGNHGAIVRFGITESFVSGIYKAAK